MREKVGLADVVVARNAAGQHGVVTVEQLLDAGLSRDGITRRVKRGRLHRVHRGVYRVGHSAPSVEAQYIAAVLACGEDAALSGRASTFLYGLVRGEAPGPEVTTTRNCRIPGVTTHRVHRLDRREVTTYRGMSIVTVPRAIVDVAGDLPLDALGRVCHEAEARYGTSGPMVLAVLGRHSNARGSRKLRLIFQGDFRITLSKLERDFLELLQSAGLPLRQTNRMTDGRYVDCRWPDFRLTVELDGYRYHHTRHAWEQDRRREREARARGDEFRRYTYGDVHEDRELVLAELPTLLSPVRRVA